MVTTKTDDSREISELFEECLKTEGITNFDVRVSCKSICHKITVKKRVDDKYIAVSRKMTFDGPVSQFGSIKQSVAAVASDIARAIKEKTTERITWERNHVTIDTSGIMSATCDRCKTSVSLDNLQSSPTWMAESSVPRPSTDTYDDLPTYKKRFALLGLLKDNCDPKCTNSYIEDAYYTRKT